MGIGYNKKNIIKDRQIFSRGPRDLQRKQQEEASFNITNELREQIKYLNEQLKKTSNEQIDLEIIKCVKEETIKYKEKINKLENEVSKLKDIIQNKEILIEQLKQIKEISTDAVKIETKPDRPIIEEVFIDPIDTDFGDVESYIKTDESIGMNKEIVAGKVNKLKKLLGTMKN